MRNLILLNLFGALSIISATVSACGASDCSIISAKPDHVLSRRRRYLLFPTGSNALITLSLVKGLILNSPRGYNLLAEVDCYYPLPDKLRMPKKKPPMPIATTIASPPASVEEHIVHWANDHPGEVWMPPSGWKGGPIYLSMYNNASTLQPQSASARWWRKSDPQPQSTYWHRSDPQLENMGLRNQVYSEPNFRPPISPTWNQNTQNHQSPINAWRRAKRIAPSEPYEEWEHYWAHRDRRSIYDTIESAFKNHGFDVRACLLRTMCEARHFLLPPGKSLFQDIFRILFRIPVRDGMSDDFTRAMSATSEDCDNVYGKTCAFSVVEMMLSSERVL